MTRNFYNPARPYVVPPALIGEVLEAVERAADTFTGCTWHEVRPEVLEGLLDDYHDAASVVLARRDDLEMARKDGDDAVVDARIELDCALEVESTAYRALARRLDREGVQRRGLVAQAERELKDAQGLDTKVAESATEAAERGRLAVGSLRRGELIDAAMDLRGACALEHQWGDDPVWGPVLALVQAEIDRQDEEADYLCSCLRDIPAFQTLLDQEVAEAHDRVPSGSTSFALDREAWRAIDPDPVRWLCAQIVGDLDDACEQPDPDRARAAREALYALLAADIAAAEMRPAVRHLVAAAK